MPTTKLIDRIQDLSSFDYTKINQTINEPSNIKNLPSPPDRTSVIPTKIVSTDYSKLGNMDRGSNDVKQPSQDYLDAHRFNDGFGNVKLTAIKTEEDIKRWAKWNITDGKGLQFNLKQSILQRFNAQKNTRIYNPVGLFTSLNPFTHAPRHGTWPLGLRLTDLVDPPTYEKKHPKSEPMENADVTSEASGFGKSIVGLFGKLAGPEKAKDYDLGTGNIKTDGGKLYSVSVSNTLQVPYHGNLNEPYASYMPKDFIKFRIRDLVNGKWLIFPAHLGSITDTVTPSYTSEKYIGRPDSTHIYTGTDRSIGFDFKVAAFTKQEIPIIQEKMNYLVGLGYPSYKSLFTGDTEARPVAPYISLTIGDMFVDTPGFFSSITLTTEEGATWELDDGFQIPQVFSVSVEFTYIGKYLPQTLGKHYEVPWLTDKGMDGGWTGTFSNESDDWIGTTGTFRPEVDSRVGPKGQYQFETEMYGKYNF